MSHRVLLLTDHAADAKTLQEVLPKAKDGPFEVEWLRRLDDAIDRLARDGIDIILMDFFLPDSKGRQTFEILFNTAPSVPVVTLVSDEETPLAIEAVQHGAQGYLVKGHFQSALVPQALRNIIQRKLVEEALFVEKERATVTLESIGDAVISTDCDGRITYLNQAAVRMTGWSKEEASGHLVADVLHLIDSFTRKPVDNPVAQVIQQKEPLALSVNSILIRRDQEEVAIEDSAAPIYDRRGRFTGVVLVFRNIGPAQTLMTAKMAYLAQYDALTGLPNRVLLNDRLAHAIASAKRYGVAVAVLFLDLDHFKNINDSLGHSMGDQLLKSVAQRLLSCIRASDTVSRYGGDEFVIVLLEDRQKEDALHTADKLLATLASPHHIEQHQFYTTDSIGISVYPNDGLDVETLIKNADTAMYHAKGIGGNNYQLFDAEMNRRAVERHSMETDLRRALEGQQFVLHYQPKINLLSGSITGVEALIRWQHPKQGFLLPDQFVPIAEASGLIVPIGRWVMHEACRQTKARLENGLPGISVAVNVSALEFRSQDYLQNVRSILKDTGLHPGFLQLELTESILMANSESSSGILHALKDIGVQLVIDDFGTGYSSLSYLQKFPIDVLKIDQSFVRGISDNDGNRIIVNSVIGMGTSLMYRVIAEGIETREQFTFLNKQHCEEGQGYFFSPPLDVEQCTRLLENGIQMHS